MGLDHVSITVINPFVYNVVQYVTVYVFVFIYMCVLSTKLT